MAGAVISRRSREATGSRAQSSATMYNREYDRDEEARSRLSLSLSLIIVFTGFCLSIMAVICPDLISSVFSGRRFADGLAAGAIIGLVLHFNSRRWRKNAREEAEDREEQMKEEEYGYRHY